MIEIGIGEDDGCGRIVEHQLQALGGIGGIKRHVGCPCLVAGHDDDHGGHAGGHVNADSIAWFDTLGNEQAGQLVSLLIEFLVG